MTFTSCISTVIHFTNDASSDVVKAKFHYASWFEAGSKLVADRFEAKFHYSIWLEPISNQIAQWNLAANLLARASSLLAS